MMSKSFNVPNATCLGARKQKILAEWDWKEYFSKKGIKRLNVSFSSMS